VIAVKVAMGAANPRRGTTMASDRDDADFEPPHTSSPTDHVLSELQLYGYRPFHDEPDPRPLPQANAVSGAVADIFDALIATLRDTPRTRPRRPAVVDRQSLPPPYRLRATRARRQ
jgi:hypothetical protein